MDEQTLQETYRLAKENNKMLHAMRRNAFWGGILKLIVYAAFLLIPLWVYMQYLAPVVNEALKTVQQAQGTGTQVQAQFADFQAALQKLQSQIPGLGSSTQ
ncbi:hypothetical protein HY418_01325 [Candidatus Kaiserbacteria bacterium]|nr:hypothetical protein [Candidatus Kaiserbacteria bacterium]